MHHCHQVPQHSEHEPGASEGGREEEELVTPLHVQKSGPEIAEVESPSSAHVLNANIASSIFGEHAAPSPQSVGASSTCFHAIRTSASIDTCGSQQWFGDVGLRLGVAHLLRGGALR